MFFPSFDTMNFKLVMSHVEPRSVHIWKCHLQDAHRALTQLTAMSECTVLLIVLMRMQDPLFQGDEDSSKDDVNGSLEFSGAGSVRRLTNVPANSSSHNLT